MKCTLIALIITLLLARSGNATPTPADPHAAVPDSIPLGPVGQHPQPRERRHLDLESTVFHREPPVEYSSRGRRDPFRAMLVEAKKQGEIDTDLLVLDGAVLTGVVWSNEQFLAMVKDKNNNTFFLREGDRVYQGRMATITQTQATFELYGFGEYERVTLKVQR